METESKEQLDIKRIQIISPAFPEEVWQIESFCLKIMEYGDYSLRKALAGVLDSCLKCIFFTIQHNGDIIAAAGCLYSIDNPSIAILGPVCTDPAYRRKGLALQVCNAVIKHLKAQNTKVVYLGVKDNEPAVNLYKKLGFTRYSGIVMRQLFISKDEFDKRYLPTEQTIIRKINWQDFAEVSALFCEPAGMYSFDLYSNIYSSKYADVQRFLPVFPAIMTSIGKNGSYGNVLLTKEVRSVVGIVLLRAQPSTMQNHITTLDFFVLDNFIDRAQNFIRATIQQAILNRDQMIYCSCPARDTFKRQILRSLGANPKTVLPDFIKINHVYDDMIIYTLRYEE